MMRETNHVLTKWLILHIDSQEYEGELLNTRILRTENPYFRIASGIDTSQDLIQILRPYTSIFKPATGLFKLSSVILGHA